MEVLVIILITTVTTLVSLSGGMLLLSGSEDPSSAKSHANAKRASAKMRLNVKLARAFQKYGTVFAAVVLLYAAFGDIIPEVLEGGEIPVWQVALDVFLGVVVCLIVSTLAGHFHKHGEKKTFKDKKQAYAMLIVDSLHTAMDGIVIGASFASGMGTGIVSSLATAAHEIPQEIGDFSIMLRSKMEKRKIIKLQVISALILVPFSVIAYFIGDALEPILPTLLSFIAGFFIYIALGEIWSIIIVIWKRAKTGVFKKGA